MTMRNPIELIVGDLGDKRRWREYRARVKRLPAGYQEAARGIERYAMIFGAVDDGPTLVRMFEDLAELLERSAADGLPIRDLVGDDPVDFLETFLDTYRGAGKSWVEKERQRLASAIDRAVQVQAGEAGR
jgi:DNA-binding ferritin-like protein (Dps family)